MSLEINFLDSRLHFLKQTLALLKSKGIQDEELMPTAAEHWQGVRHVQSTSVDRK
jgi:hypothetical protein